MNDKASRAAAYLLGGLEYSDAKSMDEALEYIAAVIQTAAGYAASTYGAAASIQYRQDGRITITLLPIDDMIKVKS